MSLWYVLILSVVSSSFNNIEEFLFIGHAYGSVSVKDYQIDQELLNYLNTIDHESYNYIVWGGDFIEDCNSDIEMENFQTLLPKSILEKSIYLFGNHEFQCYNSDKTNFIKKDENKFIELPSHDIFFLNTNFNNYEEADALSLLINSSKKNKIIFTHQVIFSKTDWLFRINSRENYSIANYFYDRIKKGNKTTHFISGDVGAFSKSPFLTYFIDGKNHFLASVIGNPENNYLLAIRIENGDVSYQKINLENFNKTNFNPSSIIFFYTKNLVQYFFLSKKRTFIFVIIFIILVLLKKNLFQSKAKTLQ